MCETVLQIHHADFDEEDNAYLLTIAIGKAGHPPPTSTKAQPKAEPKMKKAGRKVVMANKLKKKEKPKPKPAPDFQTEEKEVCAMSTWSVDSHGVYPPPPPL